MLNKEKQIKYYDELMSSRRPNKGIFSCGYDSRFDPFLLDRRPELVSDFEQILRAAVPRRVEKLLDIGCGSGFYFPILAEWAEKIVGIDFSPGMIDAARRLIEVKELGNVEVRVESAESLPFPDESFDVAIGLDVLHHIPDVRKAVAEVARVLKPGGRFASVEPNVLNPMVFLAHLLPAEERGAIRRNYPWMLRRLLKRHIGPPSSRYLFHVTSTGNRLITGVLRFFDRAMQFWPMRCLGIRMLSIAEKQ